MKSTTQKAPLEKVLSYLRYKRTLKFIKNKKVIDFGCGKTNWNEKFIGKYPKIIHGIDSSIMNIDKKDSLINIYKEIDELPKNNYEVILSMAVFEHINPNDLIEVLKKLAIFTSNDAIIFGTTPTPLSRPILEFLAYKLKLIDESQIKDHKVYYDELWLSQMLLNTDWKLTSYKTFQFGLNGEFIIAKR